MRIRSVFPALLSPQSPVLFEATWSELSSLQAAYRQMYIEEERQSRLEDADGLRDGGEEGHFFPFPFWAARRVTGVS